MRSAAVGAALLVVSLFCFSAQAALGPSVVVDWISRAQSIVRPTNMTAQLTSRYYGLVGLSMYRALQLAAADPNVNQTAVVAVAAHSLLNTWFPWSYDENDLLIKRQLGGISPQALTAARRYGLAGARNVSRHRYGDGFDTWPNFKPFSHNATGSIGRYQYTPGERTPIYPQLGRTRPLALTPADVDEVAGRYIRKWPAYFKSEEYYSDLAQLARVGGKNGTKTRTEYDTITAWFWWDGPGTHGDGGHFTNITYQVLPANMTLVQQARFFARLGAALADAAIATWRVKYSVQMWRPITAIRLPDGSTGRYTPDPTWQSYLDTPFHPSYPSGHNSAAGAWLAVTLHELGQQLGHDRVNVTISSEGGPARSHTRSYTSLSEIAKEVGLSRVYGGVHFWRDCEDGLELGIKVGQLAIQRI